MTLEKTIMTEFAYPALVIGLLLEGETVLVLGAFMAHRGHLDCRLVILRVDCHFFVRPVLLLDGAHKRQRVSRKETGLETECGQGKVFIAP